MAETIDSLSIELTADTSQAEGSINKLITMLEGLKRAVSGASNFSKVAEGIARIAVVANGIDSDAGKKLNELAAGITALSNAGNLANLKDASRNLACVVKAVNGLGAGGAGGLGSMASAIRSTGDALDGIQNADISKLGEIRDALSGEMSGSLHSVNKDIIERPELGGSVAQNYDLGLMDPGAVSIYERIAYAINEASAAYRDLRSEVGSGAMTVFKYTADSIRDATEAFRAFRAAIGAGVPPIFTDFVDGAKEATQSVLLLGSAIRGLLTEGQNFSFGSADDTFFGMRRTPLLNGVPNFTLGSAGLDTSRAIETEFVAETSAAAQESARFTGTLNDMAQSAGSVSERLNDASASAQTFRDRINSASSAPASNLSNLADQIKQARKEYEEAKKLPVTSLKETGFNEENPRWADLLREATKAYAKDIDEARQKLEQLEEAQRRVGSGQGFAGLNETSHSLKEFLNTSIKLPTVTVALKDFVKTLGGLTGQGIKAALYDLPKYFGGRLLNSIKQATRGLTGLFNSIVRIAKYRAIRTALRLITQGISQGIKNLYAWSAATNGEFKASMDMIATATQYLGNSFAAMVSPLIERLAPAIDFIIDKFVDMFNVVNQIFARLTGQTSYTAAKKIKTQWQDASESASGAAKKAAKEIRATLLGFDELNRLNAATGTSGGGGSGSGDAASAEDMFEQRPISSWIQEMVDGGDFTNLGATVARKINEALGSLNWTSFKEKAKHVVQSMVSAINGFIQNIDPKEIGQAVAEAINTGMTMIDTFWSETDWETAGQKLRTALVTFFENIDVELAADALMGKFKSLVTLIYNAIPKEESEWEIIGTKISDFINRAIEDVPWSTIGSTIGTLLMGAIKTMTILADADTLTHIAEGIKTAIESACEEITAADVAKWVGAVLQDVLRAVSVLFSIQLEIDGMKISPVALLTFGILAKTLIGKMIGGVFGATSGIGLGAGLAWTAGIALAVSTGVQIMDVFNDIKNGKPIDPQKVADIVWTAFSAVGFMMLAKGNPLGAAFMIGLGFAVKPLVKGILEIFFPKDGEVKATKQGIIDILDGAFKTVGIGLAYTGLKSGNLGLAGAGATVFGWSFFIEPIVNGILDFKKGIETGNVSATAEALAELAKNMLYAAGMTMILHGNVVGGAIAIGVAAILELLFSDVVWEWDKEASKKILDPNEKTSIFATDPLMGGGISVPVDPWVDYSAWQPEVEKFTEKPIEVPANVKTDTVNGKSWTGKWFGELGELLFPGAKAEIVADVTTSQYSQAWADEHLGPYENGVKQNPLIATIKANSFDTTWYNANIKPLADGAKANPVEVPVKLVKSATSTISSLLSSLFGKKDEKDQKVNVKTNLVKGDTSLLNTIEETPLNVKVNLVKNLWTTLERFADLKQFYTMYIRLQKQEWTTIKKFVDIEKPHIVDIKLRKNGWSTIQAFVGTAVEVTVQLKRASSWSSGVDYWIGKSVTVTVNLVRSLGWKDGLVDWMGANKIVPVTVKLEKSGWSSVWDWVTGGSRPVVIVDVKLNNASGYKSVGDFVKGKKGNASYSSNSSNSGGPAVNGASGMYSAAMQAANAAYSAPVAGVDFGGGYDAGANDSEAGWPVMPNNDREVALMQTMIDLLRQIEAKDTTVEVTAQSVTRAQQRMNRRAGVTIVPVG